MTFRKACLALVLTLWMAAAATAQPSGKALLKDFHKIAGTWKGSLTYLDYSSGKPYTMPADIVVARIGKTNQFTFTNLYPDEPKANSANTVTISTDGRHIDEELVKSRRKLPNGDIEIITEETGRDGNDQQEATFRHTYTLGKTTFKRRKDVQFKGTAEWIMRHEYVYTRKAGT